MNKTMPIIYIVSFLAVCWAPLFTMALGINPTHYEKRALAQRPSLITEDGLNLDFPHQFNTYFSDNFGLRPYYVTAYTALVYCLLNDSVNEQVIVGKDGWLFFGPTLKDFTATDVLTDQEIDRIIEMLSLQDKYLASLGIEFIFAVVPNKSSIYGEYMPSRYPERLQQNNCCNLFRALENTTINSVDLFDPLKNAKSKQQVYHTLDTHWNNIGALVAARTILRQMQESMPDYSFKSYTDAQFNIEKRWLGDLSLILLPAFKCKDFQAVYEIPENYTFQENGRQLRLTRNLEAMRIETTSQANNTSLLMFRDSFANALVPFISNNFGYVYYTCTLPYSYATIETLSPDVVILEIAERNIPNLLKYAPVMPIPACP
ncbi:hypothetical protein ACFL6U_22765 [Planctomycetota bacterium]